MPRISGARCLAFEMVGYGASIPQGWDRNIPVGRQADYMAAWLATLGIESAVFAGHDLGGGVAQIAAVRHPGLCGGLFLINAIGYDSWPIPSVKALQATAPFVRRLPDVAARQILRTLMDRGHDNRTQAREALNVRDALAVANALANLRTPTSPPRIIRRVSPGRSTGWSRMSASRHNAAGRSELRLVSHGQRFSKP